MDNKIFKKYLDEAIIEKGKLKKSLKKDIEKLLENLGWVSHVEGLEDLENDAIKLQKALEGFYKLIKK